MAETLMQTEDVPESYPLEPSGLSDGAAALDTSVVWGRIENYVIARWSVRPVTWIVEGEGDWSPPLTPATISLTERWTGEAWVEETLPTGPFGYCIPCGGPWRITASVGDTEAPEPALEAYRRLAEYMAATPGKPGAISESVTAGSVSITHRRSPSWIADALRNSGAADLLRPYRRVA
ncbi:hypothetical protein DLJ53_17515 [Acuticoccus sediminis]|uniref:PhiE125 gp8 family phage protein n=1 Tax=Acuticoccus sediminis TaxID=2184697 RepID=A0A8B2NXB4_9HYPH|nr:hypothetical protein [Acuticoccus sediminis]RAI01021.1 hypothetical protein DLJ53_17515 [Acuticoccus sediminis]